MLYIPGKASWHAGELNVAKKLVWKIVTSWFIMYIYAVF